MRWTSPFSTRMKYISAVMVRGGGEAGRVGRLGRGRTAEGATGLAGTWRYRIHSGCARQA